MHDYHFIAGIIISHNCPRLLQHLVNFRHRQSDYCLVYLVEKVLDCFSAEWSSLVILLELVVYLCSPSGRAKRLITIHFPSVCVSVSCNAG